MRRTTNGLGLPLLPCIESPVGVAGRGPQADAIAVAPVGVVAPEGVVAPVGVEASVTAGTTHEGQSTTAFRFGSTSLMP